MIGNGNLSDVEALAEFGRRLGYMSRLGDELEDCLNVKGDLLHRLKYESVPLPLLYAAKSSKKYFKTIETIIDKSQIEPLDVKILLEICFETNAFDYLLSLAEENKKKAMGKICLLKPSSARNALSSMIQQSYTRIATQVF